jgi:MPBQ/MSBQ methyltransferase
MHNPKNIIELYSGKDLPVLFKGGFINFGYWMDSTVKKNKITYDEVIDANKALYQKALDSIFIRPIDNVLEVGSGFGAGCAMIANLYNPKSLIGIDYFQSHVEHSIKLHHALVNQKKITFLQGRAENLPVPDQSIDKLLTLEAFQHFKTTEAIKEFARVLVDKGTLVISTFFALKKEFFNEILQLLPRPAILSDESNEENMALPDVLQLLEKSGFYDIEVKQIGDKVWFVYDKWVKQNDQGIWDVNWLPAYQKGLLDYFIIKATRKG